MQKFCINFFFASWAIIPIFMRITSYLFLYFLGCRRIFNIIPIAIILLINELSPELKNGSGMPVLGKMAVTTPIFTNTWKRSEEHTSELQSRPHLVCRLLLEKKKKK